jgi:uncharacterized protein YdaU (DUF1376 family)
MSKNALPYYKAYPRDFIEGTIGMSLELKGAYRVLLDLIYMQSGFLRDDARYISGLLGCSVRKWESIRVQLICAGKIQLEKGKITNSRARLELDSTLAQQKLNAENGAKAHKNKHLSERSLSQPEPEPEPDIDTNVSIKRDKPKPKKIDQEKFEEFWSAYPKKISKGAAQRAYEKATKETSHNDIIEGLTRSVQGDHRFETKQYTPYPATWLNEKGYLDDFKSAPKPNNGKPTLQMIRNMVIGAIYAPTSGFDEYKAGMSFQDAKDLVAAAEADGRLVPRPKITEDMDF